jgi:hypothetical protein
MTRQQITRRIVLGAMVAILAAPGLGVSAEDDGGYADGPTSGTGFKGYCEDNGGQFTDTEDGNLWCQWGDDSQTLCDDDGKDCHDIPYTPPAPDNPKRPTGGLEDNPSISDGGGDGSGSATGDQTSPSMDAAGDESGHGDVNTTKPGKAKGKHGKHGKHRRR